MHASLLVIRQTTPFHQRFWCRWNKPHCASPGLQRGHKSLGYFASPLELDGCTEAQARKSCEKKGVGAHAKALLSAADDTALAETVTISKTVPGSCHGPMLV